MLLQAFALHAARRTGAMRSHAMLLVLSTAAVVGVCAVVGGAGDLSAKGDQEDAAERDGVDADANVFTSAPEHWYSALSGVFFRDDAIDGGETRPMNEPSDRGVDGGDGVRGVGVHDVRHNGHRTQATLSKSSLERVLAPLFDLNSDADVRKTRRWRPEWFAGRDNT